MHKAVIRINVLHILNIKDTEKETLAYVFRDIENVFDKTSTQVVKKAFSTRVVDVKAIHKTISDSTTRGYAQTRLQPHLHQVSITMVRKKTLKIDKSSMAQKTSMPLIIG